MYVVNTTIKKDQIIVLLKIIAMGTQRIKSKQKGRFRCVRIVSTAKGYIQMQ